MSFTGAAVHHAPLSLGGFGVRRRPTLPSRNRLVVARSSGNSKRSSALPTLLFSSPKTPSIHYEYALTSASRPDDVDLISEIHLPGIAGHRLVGSSEGFLLSVDPATGDLHATDPLGTAAHHLPGPFPPTASLPNVVGLLRRLSSGHVHRFIVDRSYGQDEDEDRVVELEIETSYFKDNRDGEVAPVDFISTGEIDVVVPHNLFTRTILSPSLESAVVVHERMLARGALLRGGVWAPLRSREGRPLFCDAVFHRGLLHAVSFDGTIHIFNDDDCVSIASVPGPFGGDSFTGWKRCLVESPGGDHLFLLLLTSGSHVGIPFVKVFRLNTSGYEWDQVESIGRVAIFVGLNGGSASFCADDFPACLRPNSIYFSSCEPPSVLLLEHDSSFYFSTYDKLHPRPSALSMPASMWIMP